MRRKIGPRDEGQRLDELVKAGLLKPNQAAEVMEHRARSRKSVHHLLVELGFVREEDLPVVQAAWMGYEYIDLNVQPLDRAAVDLLPESVMRRYNVIPVRLEQEVLVIALSDPTNVIAIDDCRTITGRELRLVVGNRSDIEEALNRLRSMDRSAEMLLEEAAGPDDESDSLIDEEVESAPIVKAINRIIAQAVNQRASDIHIEPQERDIRIRYRIDGVLHEVMRTPKSLQNGMISRLKIMTDMNIAEKRVPQDGRVTMNVDKKAIDLRVTTMPSVWGEEVVMRILDRSSTVLDLEDLGFRPDSLERYSRSFRKPYGAILVTGPTGSGKSTTLYATLNVVSDPSRKVITVEDPVEYRLAGLSQVQVNPASGLTFARTLRSILRADPDVVMIGEIRDRETAGIAVEAALTGHLVLSTLHTNDAPSAVTRLVEMGVEPFLVASALDCVMAQRLARRLCSRCREVYTPCPQALAENKIELPAGVKKLYKAGSCAYCAHTGYRGRVALVEVMVVTEEVEKMVVERRSSEDMKKLAISQGMKTLRLDGISKLVDGLTSVEEVLRVVEGRAADACETRQPPKSKSKKLKPVSAA